MKATGIVRRIDELGRIVIPKEIRRILKIRESDPLEIYTDREGEIILKKYSPIGEMTTIAKECAESIAEVASYKVMITDRDQVIVVAGGVRKDYIGKGITEEFEKLMEDRNVIMSAPGRKNTYVVMNYEYGEYGQIISPIMCEGDVIGAVVLLGKNESSLLSEEDKRIAGVIASILGKQMENQ